MKRNNILKISLAALAILLGLASCKKAELPRYQNDPGIFIYKAPYDTNADSTNYSFAVKNSALTQDTIWIPVRIMGKAADRDRVINFGPVDSLTTADEGQHYTLMTPYLMPAGLFATKLGVIVKRSADLQDTTVRLVMRLKPSADLGESIVGNTDYLITINDVLTKPADWDSWLSHFFGDYSQVKYRFIIDVLGRAEFPQSGPDALEIAAFFFFQGKMANALDAYNQQHPGNPLRDENKNLISF